MSNPLCSATKSVGAPPTTSLAIIEMCQNEFHTFYIELCDDCVGGGSVSDRVLVVSREVSSHSQCATITTLMI